jgi:glycosyltransferase domain-containing protein
MISILIPTMNRSDYVIRALNYYSAIGFNGYVCLGDSSDEQHTKRIQSAIAKLQDKLHIIYRYFPCQQYRSNAVIIKELAEWTTTPYAVYSGDDDFLIPRTLDRCVAFLEAHPDYSAVNGVSVGVDLETEGAHGRVMRAYYIGAHRLESDKAVDRWTGYMRQAISSQYYVHRIETWRRMYQSVQSVPMRYLGDELLPCSFSAILGKVTELDGLACVFQAHRVKNFGWATHSMYSLMMQAEWTPSVQALRQVIVSSLMEQDGITADEAYKIFDKEFWRHILFMLQWHYDVQHDEPINVYGRLKRMKGLVAVYLWLKNIRHYKRHRWISLRALLNPTNLMHADFMRVYQAISKV